MISEANVYRCCKAAHEALRIPVLGFVFFILGFAIAGCSGNSSVAGNQTAAPGFSPGGGTYTSAQTVKISDPTSGAVLYCTTDGTTPTTSSPQCAQPTTISKTEFLQAIAVAPGMASSAVMSAGYTINLNAVATPVFSPSGGNYTSAQSVTITDSVSGANIFYTIDGTAPTTASKAYTGPITVSANTTINAIATTSGYANSAVATASYTIAPLLAPPTFSPASEVLVSPTSITISAAAGATIYYTTDGSLPPSSLTTSVYSGPITVSKVTTINAVAVLGTQTSAVASAVYSFVGAGSVPAPIFQPASGSTVQATVDTITLADTGDSNATIYYTYDGSSPINTAGTGPSSTAIQYAGAFTIPFSYYTSPGHVLVQAFALDNSYGTPVVSQVSNAYYVITAPPYPPPVFTPVTGSSSSAPATWSVVPVGQTVTIQNQDTVNPNSPIYYTTNGTTPTTSSSLYTPGTPITLSNAGVQTLEAITADPANKGTPVPATAIYIVGTAGTALSGTVVSGVNNGTSGIPITGAQVQLYAAGIAEYGSGAYVLGSPATTDKNGKFTLSGYVCPPQPEDQLYLVATGGSEGTNSPNASITLMTALGSCSSTNLPTNVTINEVTTIASAYALAAFAAPNSSGGGIDIGAPGTGANCTAANQWQSTGADTCNYNGLVSAFKAVNNLVNVTGSSQSYIYSVSSCSDITPLPTSPTPSPTFGCTTGAYSDAPGAARSITPGYSNGVLPLYDPQWNYPNWSSGPYTGQSTDLYTTQSYDVGATTPLPLIPSLNASTVPQARINSLGNVLAACVEDGAAQCSDLFTDATPTGGTAPVDTLQAALSIAQNPGSHGINPGTLLTLEPATPPYSPALNSTPQDLTLALTFTGGGLGVPYGVDHHPGISTLSGGSYDVQIFNSALAVDAAGHIWVVGYSQIGGSNVTSSNGDVQVLAEFDNLGVGLTAPTLIVDTSYDSIPGGFDPDYLNSASTAAMGLGLAIDQSGMVWTADQRLVIPVDPTSGIVPSALNSIYPQSGLSITNFTAQKGMSIAVDRNGDAWYIAKQAFNNSGPVSGIVGNGVAGSVVFDSEGNPWGAGQDDYATLNSLSGTFDVFLLSDTTGNIIYDAFAPNSTIPSTGPSTGADTSLVADGSGNVYGCGEKGGLNLDVFQETGKSAPASAGAYQTVKAPLNGTRGCGNLLVLDGQGHIFALSRTQNLIDEFGTNGTLISPSSGYSGMGGTLSGGGSEPRTLNYDTTSSSNLDPSGYDIRFGITAAVDGSGNLWVVNPDTGGTASDANVLVEYVGIAAPVVTPISVSVTPTSGGTSSNLLGVRP